MWYPSGFFKLRTGLKPYPGLTFFDTHMTLIDIPQEIYRAKKTWHTTSNNKNIPNYLQCKQATNQVFNFLWKLQLWTPKTRPDTRSGLGSRFHIPSQHWAGCVSIINQMWKPHNHPQKENLEALIGYQVIIYKPK
jgi:hypothetical protein